jgi:hypothetical protein
MRHARLKRILTVAVFTRYQVNPVIYMEGRERKRNHMCLIGLPSTEDPEVGTAGIGVMALTPFDE